MWIPRLLGAAVAALLLVSPALAKPPVWIVRDADSEMVIFGSVHVLPEGLDWEPEALSVALARTDDLWFELPMDPGSEIEIARIAASKGMLPPDKSLYDLLSPKAKARLTKAAIRFRMAPGMIDRLEPWYAEVALAGAEFREAGANADSGVEKTLSAQAPPTARRRAFETPEQQIDMFDTAPVEAQVASLEESLAQLGHDRQSYDSLVRAWMSADVAGLDKNALQPLRNASPEIYRRVVVERNTAWTRTLDERLKGSGRTVVVVGVGHLIGPGGVPARLRALGYSVEGP